MCVGVCVSAKNTAVCCLTARKSPRHSSLPLGLAVYILRKMPRKPDESSVECYGHGFLMNRTMYSEHLGGVSILFNPYSNLRDHAYRITVKACL